jgi:hypothetical protein
MYLLPILIKIGTPRFRRFVVDLLPFKNVRRLRDIIDTMHDTSVEIYKAKKHAIQEGKETLEKQSGRGRDIMSILSMCNPDFPTSLFVHLCPISQGEHGSIRRRQVARVGSTGTGSLVPGSFPFPADIYVSLLDVVRIIHLRGTVR